MGDDFRSDHRHCEGRCAYFAGYFDTRGDMFVKIEPRDFQFTRMPNTSFAKCLCVSENRPLRIYQNCCRMLRIIGCGAYLRIEEKKRQERAEQVKVPPKRSPDQTSGDVKESPLWTQVNVRRRGEEAVPMCGSVVNVRDLSVVNVDRLPESVNELFHPIKKKISDVSIFKAEEFNAGDPFAQMKTDEVDDFYGADGDCGW